jgi:hypothetical protein
VGENCVFVAGVFVDGVILRAQRLVGLGNMVCLRAHSEGPVHGSRAYQPKHTGGFTDEFFIMKIHNCLCNRPLSYEQREKKAEAAVEIDMV